VQLIRIHWLHLVHHHIVISIAQRNQTNIRVASAKGVVTFGHWVTNLHMDTDATWSNKCARSYNNSHYACCSYLVQNDRTIPTTNSSHWQL